jgi:hypothetical protein
MSLASFKFQALTLLAGDALWLMLLRLAGCQNATRCEEGGEIIFCCSRIFRAFEIIVGQGARLLFWFSRAQIFVSANFRERLNSWLAIRLDLCCCPVARRPRSKGALAAYPDAGASLVWGYIGNETRIRVRRAGHVYGWHHDRRVADLPCWISYGS